MVATETMFLVKKLSIRNTDLRADFMIQMKFATTSQMYI